VREDVALQQLVLAALGSNSLVVEQAVKVMAAAGSYAGAAQRLVRHNVVQAITELVASKDMVRGCTGVCVVVGLGSQCLCFMQALRHHASKKRMAQCVL
jgi:RNA-splicing ligase RtcB